MQTQAEYFKNVDKVALAADIQKAADDFEFHNTTAGRVANVIGTGIGLAIVGCIITFKAITRK